MTMADVYPSPPQTQYSDDLSLAHLHESPPSPTVSKNRRKPRPHVFKNGSVTREPINNLSLEQENLKLLMEISALKEQHNSDEKNCQYLETIVAGETEKNDCLIATNKSLEHERNNLRHVYAELRTKVNGLMPQLEYYETLEKGLRTTEAENKTLRLQNAELRDKNTDYYDRIILLQNQVEKFEEKEKLTVEAGTSELKASDRLKTINFNKYHVVRDDEFLAIKTELGRLEAEIVGRALHKFAQGDIRSNQSQQAVFEYQQNKIAELEEFIKRQQDEMEELRLRNQYDKIIPTISHYDAVHRMDSSNSPSRIPLNVELAGLEDMSENESENEEEDEEDLAQQGLEGWPNSRIELLSRDPHIGPQSDSTMDTSFLFADDTLVAQNGDSILLDFTMQVPGGINGHKANLDAEGYEAEYEEEIRKPGLYDQKEMVDQIKRPRPSFHDSLFTNMFEGLSEDDEDLMFHWRPQSEDPIEDSTQASPQIELSMVKPSIGARLWIEMITMGQCYWTEIDVDGRLVWVKVRGPWWWALIVQLLIALCVIGLFLSHWFINTAASERQLWIDANEITSQKYHDTSIWGAERGLMWRFLYGLGFA